MNFLMPTEVVMGRRCIIDNASIFARYGKRAMLVTGAKSAKLNGSQEDVIAALKSQGMEYIVFDKIMANPTIDIVYEGAVLARENAIQLIIGIGGGSPMDAAKVIALLAAQDISRENLFGGKYEDKILPMIMVPTTAGSGSEVTKYAILTNDVAQTKISIATPLVFPNVAMLDASYTETLTMKTTVNTAIDALSHSIEGMLSKRANAISDLLAAESIKIIAECFKELESGQVSIVSRERLLYASALGGMVISQTGTVAVHAMGYSLTYFKNVDHGQANGLLMGEFLNYINEFEPDMISKILSFMNMNTIDEFKHKMATLLERIEKITEEEIEQYSKTVMKTGHIKNCIVTLDYEGVKRIYEKSV